jgi:predicted metal-binding membrane protein
MLMVLLIAFGTMQLAWMVGLAVLILMEKVAPFGEVLTRVTAVLFVLLGAVLLINPALVTHLI